MKLFRTVAALGVLAAGLAGVALLSSSCEEAKGLAGLELEPLSVTLTPGSNLVELTVSTNSRGALSLPIEWRVTDPSLGAIRARSGYSALYVRGGPGVDGTQTIIAKDQYDNEGYATVRQVAESYRLNLTATPEPIPFGLNASVITVSSTGGSNSLSGGQSPFQWWVYDSNDGYIASGQGTPVVVYHSNRRGMNVVQCMDANGAVGAVIVVQD